MTGAAEEIRGVDLALEGVTRRFGGRTAVDGASVTLARGAIHAIVGENGAGKSTLFKLAAGVLTPDAGAVRIAGEPLRPATVGEAIRRGVGMVHQHFMLVGTLTAIENLVLGAEPTNAFGLLDLETARARAARISEQTGLRVPLDAVTDTLTVGERQRLEILRVLFRGASAILLDEPTAVLSPLEADDLYATLRGLADAGRTVAVVTHRLDEVRRFADRVTVMRRGRVVLDAGAGTSEAELTRAIMGADPAPPPDPPPLHDAAPVVLDVRGLVIEDADGHPRVDGLDLAVRRGEIVGVAGVEGNGQRELVRALAGLETRARGTVAIDGRDLAWTDGPAARRELLGVVHEDRQTDGLVLDASVGDASILGDLGRPGLDEAATVARRIARFRVEPPDATAPARALSGGNQQKLVVARAVDRLTGPGGAGRALVCAQPTRGVDVGAASVIRGAILDAARAGLAVVLVSADLAELRRLSHRIVVMFRGRIVDELAPDATDERIGRAMLGLSSTEAA